MKLDNTSVISKITSCGKDYAEWHSTWDGVTPTESWKQSVLERVRKMDELVPPQLAERCSPPAMDVLSEKDQLKLRSVQSKMLEKAKSFLERIGHSIQYEVRVIDSLGDGVAGRADVEREIVYLSRLAFDMGTKYVAGTLFEEYVHIKHGVADETRAMQDVLIGALLSAGEELAGEPL